MKELFVKICQKYGIENYEPYLQAVDGTALIRDFSIKGMFIRFLTLQKTGVVVWLYCGLEEPWSNKMKVYVDGNYASYRVTDEVELTELYAVAEVSRKLFEKHEEEGINTKLKRNIRGPQEDEDEDAPVDFEVEDEQKVGFVYVLDSGAYTADGKKIVKIGFTDNLARRMEELSKQTAALYDFVEIYHHSSTAYKQIERLLHKLLDRYRVNPRHEFFTIEALPYVQRFCGYFNGLIGEINK